MDNNNSEENGNNQISVPELNHVENRTFKINVALRILMEECLTLEEVTKKDELCNLCCDNIQVSTFVGILPCKHRFHAICMFSFLDCTNNCPICQSGLITDKIRKLKECLQNKRSESFQRREILKKKIIQNDDTCSICLTDFEPTSYTLILQCRHRFDWECLLGWVVRKNSCPLCRVRIPQINGRASLLMSLHDPTGKTSKTMLTVLILKTGQMRT